MSAKITTLLTLIAFVAFAQTPADAPTTDPLIKVGDPLVRRTVQVQEGEPAPFAGLCLNDAQAIHVAQRVASCEATLAKAEEKNLVSLPVLIAAIAGALAVGAAVATGVVLATAPKQP